ncbi:unnamed protein product [Paramecium sonneborni]|uniref:Uncharacterized protein n=1 Tax=Paramecium sonneborni TaxID=65129 RepID=A0A8S1RQZ1_9CILI|nr:unnamed protein product [Paramecium sonneborni]
MHLIIEVGYLIVLQIIQLIKVQVREIINYSNYGNQITQFNLQTCQNWLPQCTVNSINDGCMKKICDNYGSIEQITGWMPYCTKNSLKKCERKHYTNYPSSGFTVNSSNCKIWFSCCKSAQISTNCKYKTCSNLGLITFNHKNCTVFDDDGNHVWQVELQLNMVAKQLQILVINIYDQFQRNCQKYELHGAFVTSFSYNIVQIGTLIVQQILEILHVQLQLVLIQLDFSQSCKLLKIVINMYCQFRQYCMYQQNFFKQNWQNNVGNRKLNQQFFIYICQLNQIKQSVLVIYLINYALMLKASNQVYYMYILIKAPYLLYQP